MIDNKLLFVRDNFLKLINLMRLDFTSKSIKKIKFKRDEYFLIIKIIKKATHWKSFLSDLSNDKLIPLKGQESFLMSSFYHFGEK